MVLPVKPALPFSHIFLHWFSILLFNLERSLKGPKLAPQNSQKTCKSGESHHRNAPTAKSCKKALSGKGQASGIDNHYNSFNFFPKAQRSQREAKRWAEIEALGTPSQQKSENKAPENRKEHDHEKLARVSILVKNTFARLLGPMFEPWANPGTKIVPKSPPRAPGTAPDRIFNRFWMALELIFVGFRHHKT